VLPTIDFSRIETALASGAGWLELAIVAGCFAIGWRFDRRVCLKSGSDAGFVRVGLGSVNRLLLPLVTLLLLLMAAAAFRYWQPPFFLAIAILLTIALALIRLLVYAMHEVFGTPAWLPASERVIGFTIWLIVLLHFIGVLPELWAELDALTLPIGSKQVSVYELLKGAVVVVVTIAATLWLSGLVEQRLQGAGKLDTSVRAVVSKLLRAALLVVGVLIALQAVGIDLTLLAVFGGALGVGIGLGLQKLASNYIAGFTILLDRSIRLGDAVTLDNRFGVVAEVKARYVVIRGLDGVEAIVPNETLVTTTVLNHTYSNREIRMAVPVQVSHDSDVQLALRLLEVAARAEPRVLKAAPNEPMAFLVKFAERGIDLELGVWINDPQNGQLNLRSALNQTILRSFRANGIHIPHPQRELRVVGLPDRVAAASPGPEPAGPAG
jgi:small-conductance mechanosensitive channel